LENTASILFRNIGAYSVSFKKSRRCRYLIW